jgi:hypothetical protein
LRKEFSSKIDHLKSNRRRIDDASDLLCNIQSSIGARANGASTMVTAALLPHPRVANADTLDRANVPQMPGLVGGGALAAKDQEKNRQVNHADAPQDMLRRFGTDLAPRAFTGALRLTTAGLQQIVEMNCSVSLTLTLLLKRRSALQRPKV